jgi:hypothetical protein
MIDSTRCLSYPICMSELMSCVSVARVTCFADAHQSEFISIDPLSSTMIFCAVFFPIPETDARRLSSLSSMARRIFSVPRPRIFCAVFPHTPLTERSFRKIERS